MNTRKNRQKVPPGDFEFLTELEEWKTKMNSEISNLGSMIAALEKRITYTNLSTSSFYAGSVIDEPCRDRRCRNSRWLSITLAWQIFCLLGCLSIVIIFGYQKFVDAHENEDDDYKPEKKTKAISYGDGLPTLQYEMPHIHFLATLYSDNKWTSEMCDETTAEMEKRIRYDSYINYDDTSNRSTISAKVRNMTGNRSRDPNWFKLHFIFDLENPVPKLGKFQIELVFYSDILFNLTQVDLVPHVLIGISRDDGPVWVMMEGCPNTTCRYEIQYSEKVVHQLDGSNQSTITSRVGGHSSSDKYHDNNTMMVFIEPDLTVEYWKEYLEYGYVEWFMAMGGVTSFSMTAFFFASGLASKTDLGILPYLSLLYRNHYEINQIKESTGALTLEERKITTSKIAMKWNRLVGFCNNEMAVTKTFGNAV